MLQLALYRGVGCPSPSPATPLPFLSCPLLYMNSSQKNLHFCENFMKIRSKLKKINVKGQFYVYSIFEIFFVEWHYILQHILILSTSHDTWCPHSCMTMQKAPVCPQILAGTLMEVLTISPSLLKKVWGLNMTDSTQTTENVEIIASTSYRQCPGVALVTHHSLPMTPRGRANKP